MSACEDGVGDGPCGGRIGATGPVKELQRLQLKGGAAAEDAYCPLALREELHGGYNEVSGDWGGKQRYSVPKMPIGLLTSQARCQGIRPSATFPPSAPPNTPTHLIVGLARRRVHQPISRKLNTSLSPTRSPHCRAGMLAGASAAASATTTPRM